MTDYTINFEIIGIVCVGWITAIAWALRREKKKKKEQEYPDSKQVKERPKKINPAGVEWFKNSDTKTGDDLRGKTHD